VADGVSIAPANAAEDAHALRWAFWTVTELEADALTVLMHRMALPQERRNPALAEAAESRLVAPLRVLEQHLLQQAQQGQSHLAADRLTVADVCVASVANWVRPAKALMAQHPHVQRWLMACMDRPAYQLAKSSGV
jgi:glutathione S-transferase